MPITHQFQIGCVVVGIRTLMQLEIYSIHMNQACCDWAHAPVRDTVRSTELNNHGWLTIPVGYKDNRNYLCLVYFADKTPCNSDYVFQNCLILLPLLLIHSTEGLMRYRCDLFHNKVFVSVFKSVCITIEKLIAYAVLISWHYYFII